jgi:tetratricopeptide (TPR) repeat protein
MSKRRTLLIIIAVAVFVLGVLAFTFRYQLATLLAGVTNNVTGSTNKLGEVKLESSLTTARSQVASGDTAGAQKSLDKAIEQTSSAEEKAQLYSQKSSISASTGNIKDAIASAEAAAQNEPSVDSYDTLGYLQEKNGDKAAAIAAYQKVVEQFDKNPPAEEGQVNKDYYLMKIKQLEAQS